MPIELKIICIAWLRERASVGGTTPKERVTVLESIGNVNHRTRMNIGPEKTLDTILRYEQGI